MLEVTSLTRAYGSHLAIEDVREFAHLRGEVSRLVRGALQPARPQPVRQPLTQPLTHPREGETS